MGVFTGHQVDVESAQDAKRRVSRHGGIALLAMLAPAVLFPVGLVLVSHQPAFSWALNPLRWPAELWVMAVFGSIATVGGVLDWLFHRSGQTSVGRPEHHSHVAALVGGGIPMFALMCAASLSTRPQLYLLPILVVFGYTLVLICYDEFVFHRKRCDTFETITHRMLTLGNGVAWLAWMCWIFVRTRPIG
jgi:hypothetical protein